MPRYTLASGVLRVAHAERPADVGVGRVDLQTQVAAADGVEKIEAYREALSESLAVGRSEQFVRPEIDEVRRRGLEEPVSDAQIEAVFLRYAVEAPAVVDLPAVQIADLLHPLPAPGCGVEERHDTERPPYGAFDPLHERLGGEHERGFRAVRVDPVVDPVVEALFMVVQQGPVVEIPAFVLPRRAFGRIVDPESVHGVRAESLLDLPAGHVGVDGQFGRRGHVAGAAAVYDRRDSPGADPFARRLQFFRVEIVSDAQRREVAE